MLLRGILAVFVLILTINAGWCLEYFSWSSAAQYDSNIKQYVLDNFYTDTSKAFGWKESSDTDSLKLVLDPDGTKQYVLRVFYEKGTRASYDTNGNKCVSETPCKRGAQFYVMPPMMQSVKQATAEYEVYFENGFEFVKGGKLPGLYGGSRSSCKGCSGVDGCFSTRLMWRENGQYEVYGYMPINQIGGWENWCNEYGSSNKNMVKCSNSCGSEIGLTYSKPYSFTPGKWHKIRQEVDVGEPNQSGRVALWVDGALIVQMTNIVLRTSPDIFIDGLFFSTFYGGSDSSWGQHEDTYTYFRNIRISDEKLGGNVKEYFVEKN